MEPHEMAMEALAAEEQAQDLAFRTGREIIRKTKRAISGIHNGRRDPELIDSVSSDLAGLCEALEGFPRVLYGQYVEDAMAEFAETVIYDRALRGEDIPDYTVLEVSPSAWLLGLADSVGELRRDMLARLMDGDADGARRIFSTMESLSDILMEFDVKDSVVPIRRKQDICRGIMEKSRGDLAAAKIMKM
jgi:translin